MEKPQQPPLFSEEDRKPVSLTGTSDTWSASLWPESTSVKPGAWPRRSLQASLVLTLQPTITHELVHLPGGS